MTTEERREIRERRHSMGWLAAHDGERVMADWEEMERELRLAKELLRRVRYQAGYIVGGGLGAAMKAFILGDGPPDEQAALEAIRRELEAGNV